MRVAGILAEYNPFHAGHAWHIARTREAGATHVVAVMSGYAVQRGEFAIARKQARARMALENGVDLVICLPAPFSCARAQDFARGGVYLLQSLGCVDTLSFGSECGEISLIQRAASGLRQGGVKISMRASIGEGSPFAAARQAALARVDPEAAAVLRSPNDTLAVEYLTAMGEFGAGFAPLAVPRRGAAHDTTGGKGFPSASELRIIFLDRGVPEEFISSGVLRNEAASGLAPVDMRRLEIAWLARLRCMGIADLARLPDVSEGMEHLLSGAIRKGGTVEEILSIAGGRRYPTARLRRVLFHALLGVASEDLAVLPRFIQVIGHNAAGQELLRQMKSTASLPIILRHREMKALSVEAQRQYALECRAADLMALAMPKAQPCGMEERREVVIYRDKTPTQ
ncbi:MAG: nucleotidyltransferase family protein [Oscillospiraceae bacterium]|jgi:predicted nucleotidyltransferase|nr:nucleotidyltransferase family protein [Oscillospiraceae bacterium]